jgi:uncharacterized protein
MQTYLKTKPVWIQLLLFLGMAFGLFLILSFAGVIVLSKLTGLGLLEVQNVEKWDYTNPKLVYFVRGLLTIQFLGLFVIPSLVFAYFADPQPMKFLGFKPPSNAVFLILGILAMIVAIPAVEYIGVLNQKMHFGNETQKWMKGMEEEASKQIKFMLSKHTLSELVANLFFIAAFAGIGEELFFRGVLQRMFIRMFKDPWAGIVLTAAIFSAFHFQFFGFFPRLALGILLGAMYWYSGSLWISIIVHFLYDGLMIVAIYLNPKLIENTDQTIMNPSSLIYGALISVLLVIILLRYMKKKSVTSYKEVYSEDQPKDPFTF